MKKSVLAVAIAAAAFAASAASAAQVYDKDGTTLAVGGQIEFMAGNAGNTYFGNKSQDATTRDRARLTMAGRTQLTNGIAAYAYNEWQIDHKGTSQENQEVLARQQYLGVDFGKFGKVQVGRYVDPFEYASNLVDVLDEVGVYGGFDERNSGHISYMWSGYGFDAGISYQMAVDSYRADEFGGSFDVDSGFSIYAGYTSPAVVFGPISVRAAYLYLNGQDNKHEGKASKSSKTLYGEYDEDSGLLETVNMSGYLDNAKSIDGSLAWGTNGKGLYLATNYNYSKLTFVDSDVISNIDGALGNGNVEWKAKAWETVVTYGFENGIRLGASYHYIKHEATVGGEEGKASGDTKFVQLIADYNVTPNFKVWAEGLIDAGSDDYFAKITSATDGFTDDNGKFVNTCKDGHNSIMFGARYVF
ncbi:MAG TPA: hypothetical protein DCL74_03950 [Succinivibrionaceae bacterium]|nr:hypothetical protein [Succinivibrionaceae bacterium]